MHAAHALTEITGPASREQSLMLTQLEQAMLWANAAVAQGQVGLADRPGVYE